jgi:hypothetical protein
MIDSEGVQPHRIGSKNVLLFSNELDTGTMKANQELWIWHFVETVRRYRAMCFSVRLCHAGSKVSVKCRAASHAWTLTAFIQKVI